MTHDLSWAVQIKSNQLNSSYSPTSYLPASGLGDKVKQIKQSGDRKLEIGWKLRCIKKTSLLKPVESYNNKNTRPDRIGYQLNWPQLTSSLNSQNISIEYWDVWISSIRFRADLVKDSLSISFSLPPPTHSISIRFDRIRSDFDRI